MANTKFSIVVHEKARQANNLAHAKRIKRIFDKIAAEAAAIGARTGFNDAEKHFYFADYPAANKAIDDLLKDMHAAVLDNVQSGNADAWSLANAKNAAMVADLQARAMAAGRDIAQEHLRQWSQTNLDALQAFQERKVNGMGLSSRVWNITDQTKSELEMALEIGLGDGKSAAVLSRDVRSYLNEPNRLFRRVRDKKTGVLRLSKAAQQYHTGRGVYRSSYKNALRMTATENNMAYRNADHERWQQIPWILGYTIKLSGNHPVTDICDELQGDYPKEFKFTGWHPWCRCYCISKRAKDKDIFDALDSDDPENYQFEGEIKDMPKQFTDWVKDNEERIQNAKSLPYFIKDNFVGGDVTRGYRWQQAAVKAASKDVEKAAAWLKGGAEGDIDVNLWDKFTAEQKWQALRKSKFTGMVDMDEFEDFGHLLKPTSKKEALSIVDDVLRNVKEGFDMTDENHYVLGYADGTRIFTSEMAAAKVKRTGLRWITGNSGLSANMYWAADAAAEADMCAFMNFIEVLNGEKVKRGRHLGMQAHYANKTQNAASEHLIVPMKDAVLTEEQIKNRTQFARLVGYDEQSIKEIAIMDYEHADRGNANYFYDNSTGYKTNCQTVAPVMELRFRGIDVAANAYMDGGYAEAISNDMALPYIDPATKTKPIPVTLNSKERVIDFFKNETAKEGRYVFGFDRWKKQKDGHIFNVIIHKGKPYFIDGQVASGEWYDLDSFIDGVDFDSKVQVMRVDKLCFDYKFAEAVTLTLYF